MYIHRQIEETLKKFVGLFPAVTVTGPRQSGKSTMLKECLKDYDYITFDRIQNIEDFSSDPESFIQKYKNKVIFDEAQQVPELFNYIKFMIDEDRQNYIYGYLPCSTGYSNSTQSKMPRPEI